MTAILPPSAHLVTPLLLHPSGLLCDLPLPLLPQDFFLKLFDRFIDIVSTAFFWCKTKQYFVHNNLFDFLLESFTNSPIGAWDWEFFTPLIY